NFTGPKGVKNVLVRVTRGASNIDGTIRTGGQIRNANFFLMNPAGVVFGPDARLDIQGSFAVTSADFLANANGERFLVTGGADPVLFTSAPVSFGFLASNAGIRIDRARLSVPQGKAISIVSGNAGGGLAIAGEKLNASGPRHTGGVLRAPGGQINLVSVGSAGEALLDATDVDTGIKIRSFEQMGDITLSKRALASVDGDAG